VVRPNFGFEENEPEFRSTDSVVCVSRLTPEKGVLDLVRNWPQGAGSPSLTVLGDGPQYGEISSISAALDNVTLAGFTSHEDVIEILRDSAASVVPSQWAEPFGRVAIESMSVGTPVIYATNGALADIVGPGGTPLNTLEESSIREALDRIFGADDRSAIRRSAYRHYSNRFTSRKAATSMRELIDEVRS
jgi:glycosyltransferase involved in cell wall biosynthesis